MIQKGGQGKLKGIWSIVLAVLVLLFLVLPLSVLIGLIFVVDWLTEKSTKGIEWAVEYMSVTREERDHDRQAAKDDAGG